VYIFEHVLKKNEDVSMLVGMRVEEFCGCFCTAQGLGLPEVGPEVLCVGAGRASEAPVTLQGSIPLPSIFSYILLFSIFKGKCGNKP
jgi:hypothetical protein